MSEAQAMPTVFITGASRGVGGALIVTQQLEARSYAKANP
jgi:short-subunit dehydrogenase